ncbi:endonuclease V [Leclercia adecarboxylata]|nr:endonuclease V [Leclercia adecarboxylata]MDC6700515.1 endonuclease V [Leclercia adecarboxylata]
MTLETSLEWVMRCLGRTKLPEPTRLADRLASRRDQRK